MLTKELKTHSISNEYSKFVRELDLETTTNKELKSIKQAKNIKKKAKKEGLKKIKENWKNKLLHGQYPICT